MRKIIFYLISCLLIILIAGLLLKLPKQVNALFAEGGGGGGFGTRIYVYAYNSGTTWKTKLTYFRQSTGETFTTTISSGEYWDLGFTINANDTLKWLTACVDPESNITAILNVSCRSYDAASTSNCESIINAKDPISCGIAYGACGGPNDYPSAGSSGSYSLYATNYGTVAYSLCPIPNDNPGRDSQSDENKFRCAYKGYVSGVGYVGCRNTCNYRYCGGSGTSSVYWLTTEYSNKCGGNQISGTYMCSNYSYSCSPPAPTVNATTSCSNGQPRISATWSTPEYSNGGYDLRWRESGGSWNNVCAPTEPFVISSGLSDSTTYQIQVRGNTTSGHNGPTNFGSDTVTTLACATPNIVIDSITIPSGYAGATGNASVTIRNAGTASTGVGFSVGFLKDGTSANCSTTFSSEVSTSALGTGATRTLNFPFTYSTTAGSHTGVAMVDSNCQVGESNESDNTRTDAYTVTANNLTINVYQDLNGNGADDGGTETGYSGANIIVTGTNIGSATSSNCTRQSSSSLSCTTNASGQIAISTILPGSTTANLTVPTGFTSTTTDPVITTFPPSQTINFGIQPAAPTCSGGLTASPVTVNPGQTSTLRANGCTTPAQGATITYTWLTPAPGSITSTNPSLTSTATWTAPNPYWTDIYAYPTVNVCQTGTTLCRPYAISNGLGVGNQGIHIVPLFTVSGNVFVDQNKDSLQNGADANYTGGITLTPNPTGVTVTYPSPGNYVINNMPGGQYTISYPSLPTGYQMTYPKNGPPPSFTVRVGNLSTGGACSVSGHNAAACDINGNITALKYGITNSIPWIQSTGGDITGNEVTDPSGGGISNTIPPGASCGPYMSLTGSGGTPGVIYAGAGSYSFGSGQASQNPYNWVVGGLSYPDTYIPTTPGVIRTSYGYMRSLATQSGLTPVDIAGYCGAGGTSSCTLSASLPNGLYISNGNLTLTGASYTFPANRNFVILVNGNLTINTEVHVPIGSTAFFTTSGDISVGSNVGETVITSTRSNVEGYYSTDRNFYSLGLNACPTVDRRLNVAGSIVVNASLTGGSFINQRDLCAGDLQCPVFMVIERPDFVLNSPEFLKSARRVWREIAP